MAGPSNNNQPGRNIFPDAQDILMNTPMGIFRSTPKGRLLSVNPAMVRMFGYDSPQDMMESVTDIESELYADPADKEKFKLLLS